MSFCRFDFFVISVSFVIQSFEVFTTSLNFLIPLRFIRYVRSYICTQNNNTNTLKCKIVLEQHLATYMYMCVHTIIYQVSCKCGGFSKGQKYKILYLLMVLEHFYTYVRIYVRMSHTYVARKHVLRMQTHNRQPLM